MTRRVTHAIGLLLLIASFVVAPQQPVRAATLTAGSAAELIGAITLANTVAGADTIVLTTNITLTSVVDTGEGSTGLPAITSDVTIDGRGFTITRAAGAPDFRILRVAGGGNLTLLNVTINNGSESIGGGILNRGTLKITNSTLSGSAADFGGGVANINGTLTITNSTLSGNAATGAGGGVYNDSATLTITHSTLSGNAASGGSGGGIYNTNGVLTITNSTFSGNTAGDSGGGVLNTSGATITITNSTLSGNAASGGGGVYNVGTFTITNSTLSGNTASSGGAVLNDQGGLTISNSTLSGNTASGNGGGVWNNLTLTINYSTLSGNSAADGGGVYRDIAGTATIMNSIIANSPSGGNCGGFAVSGSFSLEDDDDCSGFMSSGGINLAPLADNGGSTRTHALNLGSSALDFSDPLFCILNNPLDQRGADRGVDGNGIPDSPQSGDCDIGAFERGVTIHTLQFAAPGSTFNPGGVTTLPVTLTLDAPLAANYGPITAYVWVSGGTAVAGTDYAPFGAPTVTFNPGDQTKTVTLNLFHSGLTTDRTVVVSFATTHGPGFSGPARLGALTSHTVTLKASLPSAAPTRDYYGTRDVRLTWAGVSWATGYEIQVDNENSFAAPRVAESNTIPVGTLFYDVTVPGNGTFYWRVRALGGSGVWSPTQSFVVAGT